MEFEGYFKKPTESEVLLLLSVLSYLKNKFGVTYASYEDDEGTVVKKTISNAVTHRSMHASAYAALTKRVFQVVVEQNSAGELTNLRNCDSFMRPILNELFPMLREQGLLPDQPVVQDMALNSLYSDYSSKDSATLRLFAEKFKDGGYIYRYARNKDNSRKDNPRIAKGELSIYNVDSNICQGFTIKYHVDSASELSDPYDDFIDGKVYLLKSFFLFTGIERDRHNPFVMVMKADLQGSRFKAMILRKHPTKSYFASRVMLSSDLDNVEPKTGKFNFKDLPEVNDRQLLLIANEVRNSGKSILMMED